MPRPAQSPHEFEARTGSESKLEGSAQMPGLSFWPLANRAHRARARSLLTPLPPKRERSGKTDPAALSAGPFLDWPALSPRNHLSRPALCLQTEEADLPHSII